MNRFLPWVLTLFTAFATAAAPLPAAPLGPVQAHAETAVVSNKLLSRYHYQPTELDDAMSSKIFDRYLKALDPERLFLVKADIEQFAGARTLLDDAILKQDLRIPFAIFARYTERVDERIAKARALLDGGFDFSQAETYRHVRSEEPWAASVEELDEIWRKRVKNDWLRLKLAGKDDTAIRQTLMKRYDTAQTRNRRFKSDDVFQVFMNAYANSIEPHTSYLGPRASEDFAISMKLSLVGIGAVLQERDEYIIIRELVAGGPASKSGRLAVGDRIVGVAQGENAAITDVLGWRVDEVVALIRGAKGSVVVLDVLPAEGGPDAEHKRVTMVRDTIKLENQAAAKSVIEVGEGADTRRIGVIKLPTFYQDVDARRSDPEFRSATRDVQRLLGELKSDRVDAVLLDLRDNGGGSLDEAISLTGLFIDTGPVVQQRNAQGQIRVERDVEPGLAWEGPLGVMINRASASASEIFAAAIQDYGRGVVIGEPSFGKGTVQTLINLDEIARSDKPQYGELKMTIAQFYRISGGTTQLRGVTPDIALPSLVDQERFGESSYDNALPWTSIPAARFSPAGNTALLLPALAARHAERTAADAEFAFLREDIADVQTLRAQKEVSLKESERRAEREQREARVKARALARQAASPDAPPDTRRDILDDGLLSGERQLIAELAAEQSDKSARDILLDEAGEIMGDMVDMLRADPALTARALPSAASGLN